MDVPQYIIIKGGMSGCLVGGDNHKQCDCNCYHALPHIDGESTCTFLKFGWHCSWIPEYSTNIAACEKAENLRKAPEVPAEEEDSVLVAVDDTEPLFDRITDVFAGMTARIKDDLTKTGNRHGLSPGMLLMAGDGIRYMIEKVVVRDNAVRIKGFWFSFDDVEVPIK